MGRLRQVLMVSAKFPLRPSENFPQGVAELERSLSLSLPLSLKALSRSLASLQLFMRPRRSGLRLVRVCQDAGSAARAPRHWSAVIG